LRRSSYLRAPISLQVHGVGSVGVTSSDNYTVFSFVHFLGFLAVLGFHKDFSRFALFFKILYNLLGFHGVSYIFVSLIGLVKLYTSLHTLKF